MLRAKNSVFRGVLSPFWIKCFFLCAFFLGSMSAYVIVPLVMCAVMKTWTQHIISARTGTFHLLSSSLVSSCVLKSRAGNLYTLGEPHSGTKICLYLSNGLGFVVAVTRELWYELFIGLVL